MSNNEPTQLNEFAPGTFATVNGVAGVCEVFVAPPSVESWDITSYAVITSDPTSGTVFPEARIYVDTVADGNFLEGTYSGNMDMSDKSVHLEKGQRLYCRWVGGTNGRTATFSVFGTKTRY